MLKGFFQNERLEAGCDEAGRGCLAGPVYAAAVILPHDYYNPLLNDSKQLSAKQRYGFRKEIENNAVAWSVAFADNNYIDQHNILIASIHSMHLAVEKLGVNPGFLIIDGNYFIGMKDIQHRCIVKGDTLYLSIAAASILAKTYRDDYMEEIHNQFPNYNWKKNKGYPTLAHRHAIQQYGISQFHRISFNLGL